MEQPKNLQRARRFLNVGSFSARSQTLICELLIFNLLANSDIERLFSSLNSFNRTGKELILKYNLRK